MSRLTPFNRKNRSVVSANVRNPFNMIEDFVTDAFTDVSRVGRNLVSELFKVDVREMENEYLIEAELPGVEKKDIELSLDENGKLSIAVNQDENVERNDENQTYIHRERYYESMQRSIYLADAQPDSVQAKLEDGLLKVTVRKEEQAKEDDSARKIEIN